ncbi:MAG: Mpo1-like protein [Aulosira sp. ZfuVER01]|nr:Mpo1-like protein [Aulosira sp. ZfuVER01]MDZ7996982.1 Mpo1-like protein [Aulosira sp. DedVER01a]MDZ8053011.1 Mpo1-like protein [Aulosira sp. ZfuCHP01]
MNQFNYIFKQNLRNKINNQILEHPFTDYWDIFVLKHQHPINISLHIVGIFFFYGLLFSACKVQNFWLLLGLPLTQLIGLTGHFLFERSYIDLQDAVFSWRASYCLGRMLLRVVMGKYQDDIRQRQEILNNYQSSKYANI